METPKILVDKWGAVHIEHEPLDERCGICERARAVQHGCNAHGYPIEIHPHGGIHQIGGDVAPVYACRECGTDLLRQNDQMTRLNQYLKRGWL